MNMSKNIKIDWPKQSVLALIHAWEQNECLYNCKNELYHNKHARNAALEKITSEVEEFIPNITTNEIKTKMNYLRTEYCRELSKVKESCKSGSGYDDVYTPTAYWFDGLNFLRGYVNIKRGNSSVPLIADVDLTDVFDLEEPVASSSASSAKKRKRTIDIAPEDDILLQAKELLEKVVQPTATISKYDEGLLLFLQGNLCDITDKALKDELSEEIISLVMQYKRKQRNIDNFGQN